MDMIREILEPMVRDSMEDLGYEPWEESAGSFVDEDGLSVFTIWGYMNGIIAKFGLKG